MRAVRRGAPPPALGSLLGVAPDRTWSSDGEGEVHDAIRDGLRSAQHRICAYCERPVPTGGRVEHVHPKSLPACLPRYSNNPGYDWDNLLLVCGATSHCDGPKGDLHLCDSVLFPDEMVREGQYFSINSLTGKISAYDELEPAVRLRVSGAIDELRLNDPDLKAMRVRVIGIVRDELETHGDLALARHRASVTGGFVSTIAAYLDPC